MWYWRPTRTVWPILNQSFRAWRMSGNRPSLLGGVRGWNQALVGIAWSRLEARQHLVDEQPETTLRYLLFVEVTEEHAHHDAQASVLILCKDALGFETVV